MTDRTQAMTETAEFQVWKTDARRDDWHTRFVGSDIRQMLSEIERLETEVTEWKQAASVEAGLRREFAARIAELESNEKAYEEIIGKKTFQEVADLIGELEIDLRDWQDSSEAYRKDAEALKTCIDQIKIVCIDNAPTTVRHDLALEFIGSIVTRALQPKDDPAP